MSHARRVKNNIWEMKKGVDIVLFVNTHMLANGHWSEAVDRVNLKYPILHQLLRFNRVYGKQTLVFIQRLAVVNVCWFFLSNRSAESSRRRSADMEKGLRIIRYGLPGYRCLAVQQGSLARDFQMKFPLVFNKNDGELWLCGEPNGDRQRHSINTRLGIAANRLNILTVETLEENIWQLATGYGLVMFIDMQVMLMDDWRDEIVELVDARYPFKALLLEKINIKPMAAGEVLMLPVDRSVIICIFYNFCNSNDSNDWLKKAFSTIRDSTAGNVRLVVQMNTSLPVSTGVKAESSLVYAFKSVFTQHLRDAIRKVTLFLCGRQLTNENP